MKVAPAHRSPYRCPSCARRLTLAQERIVISNGDLGRHVCDCGKEIRDCTIPVTEVRATNAHLLDVDAVRAASWFHATTRTEWIQDLIDYREDAENDLMVHLGTHAAASHRAADLAGQHFTYGEGEQSWVMYEVKLKTDTIISNDVLTDDGGPSNTSMLSWSNYAGTFVNGANRYLNVWEEPGSISLLVPSDELIVVSVSPFDPLTTSKGARVHPQSQHLMVAA